MYEEFYHLSAKPFSLLPDADFLFLSQRHRRAVNLLEYGILTQAGFIAITGEVGAGKTTVIRRYLKNVGRDVTVGVITNPSPSIGRLLNWVSMAFELDHAGLDDVAMYNNFVNFLVKQYSVGKRTILIIDEAQNLEAKMLEELRMLSNVNNEKDQLLQMVLVGQPELLELLKRPDLRQFAQRISVHCHLDPLSAPETAAYIRHRLHVVGGAADLFDDLSCAAVYYFTGGVPRLINLLCDQALVYGFSDDKEHIDLEVIAAVVADRNRGGLSAFREYPAEWTLMHLRYELSTILRDIKLAAAEPEKVD